MASLVLHDTNAGTVSAFGLDDTCRWQANAELSHHMTEITKINEWGTFYAIGSNENSVMSCANSYYWQDSDGELQIKSVPDGTYIVDIDDDTAIYVRNYIDHSTRPIVAAENLIGTIRVIEHVVPNPFFNQQGYGYQLFATRINEDTMFVVTLTETPNTHFCYGNLNAHIVGNVEVSCVCAIAGDRNTLWTVNYHDILLRDNRDGKQKIISDCGLIVSDNREYGRVAKSIMSDRLIYIVDECNAVVLDTRNCDMYRLEPAIADYDWRCGAMSILRGD